MNIETITKRVKLYPKQHDFFMCPDRFAGFIGGIASGKTWVGCLWGLQQAKPGTLGLVVAPTYPMLRDVTWRTFQEIGGEVIAEKRRSDMIQVIRGGGEILFRSADDPDRLRGPNAHWALIDEASLCPKDTWDIVIGRLRADGQAGPCRVVATPKGRNWLYTRQGEMTIFRAATHENPYLSKEFIESLERSYTGNFARQELYGEFVAFEGLVYPMFSRDVHIKTRIESEFPTRWFGNDEGYTNPAVILDVGMDNDGRLHVFREWYRRGQLQNTVVAVNQEWYNKIHPQGVVVDASAAGLIAALRAVNVHAMGHTGRVQDGISKVQNLLAIAGDKKPRLTIDPSCVHTIAEIESYCWKEGKDEPEKQNDHCLIAGTMIKTKYGEKPIELINTGEEVLTRGGYKRVIASGITGKDATVMTVHLSNGKELCGTPEHLVWVIGKGYKSLYALRYGDIMYTCQTRAKLLNTAELNLDAIHCQRDGLIEFIMFPTPRIESLGSEDYTKKYGKRNMAKFLPRVLSTIKTTIHSTIKLTTLCACLKKNTTRSMPIKYQSGGVNGLRKMRDARERRHPVGTNPKKAESGTRQMVFLVGLIESLLSTVANIVGQNSRLLPCTERVSFVPIRVNPLLGGQAEKTTKQGFVNIVEKNSSAINIPELPIVPVFVLKEPVEEKNKRAVYDLTIDGEHEFFAAGILVHNSMDTVRYIADSVGGGIITGTIDPFE